MIRITKISPVGFASNSYLLTADGREAVVIDPAQPRVFEEAEKLGLQVKYVLLTHGHFDHVGGCAAFAQHGAEIGCLRGEEKLARGANNLARQNGVPLQPFSVAFTVEDGQELSLCGMSIQVIATPGHTSHSACYLVGDALFSGDTLFLGCVGRWDLPTGDGNALENSVRKLYSLSGDYTVYPGHGENTTLERERRTNGVIRAC